MHQIVTILVALTCFLPFSIGWSEDYPVPEKTKELLFYIQRNHNKNTIIYDANFDEKGMLT